MDQHAMYGTLSFGEVLEEIGARDLAANMGSDAELLAKDVDRETWQRIGMFLTSDQREQLVEVLNGYHEGWGRQVAEWLAAEEVQLVAEEVSEEELHGDAEGDETTAMMQVLALVLMAAQDLAGNDQEVVREAVRQGQDGDPAWMTLIGDEVWLQILETPTQPVMTLVTMVQMSRVNRPLHDRLAPLIAKLKEAEQGKPRPNFRMVSTQRALDAALADPDLDALISIMEGEETEFVVDRLPQAKDSKYQLVEIMGHVTVTVTGGHVHALRGSKAIVRDGGEADAMGGSTVTSENGGKVYAGRDSTVTVKDGGKADAFDGSTVIVNSGGQVRAVAGANVTVYDGGFVEAHEGSKVTIHPGGSGQAYEGAMVGVPNGPMQVLNGHYTIKGRAL